MIKNPEDLISQLVKKELPKDKLDEFFQAWTSSLTHEEIAPNTHIKDKFSVFRLDPKTFIAKIIFLKPEWHKYAYNLHLDERIVLSDIDNVGSLDNLKNKKKITVANFIQMSFMNLIYSAVNHSSYSVGASIEQAISKIELLFNNVENKYIQAAFSTPFIFAGREVFLADLLVTSVFKAKAYPYRPEDYEKIMTILVQSNVNLLSTGLVQYLPNLLATEQIKALQIVASHNPHLKLSSTLELGQYFAYLHKNRYSENPDFNSFLEKHFLEENLPEAQHPPARASLKV